MLSIRGKLTLWYLAILAAVLIGYGIIIYLYLSTTLLGVIDASLRDQVITLEQSLLAVRMGEDLPDSVTGRLSIAPQFVELLDPEGETTDMALGSETYHVTVNRKTLDRVLHSQEPVLEDAVSSGGKAMRIATWRILDDEGNLDYYLRAGYVIEDIKQTQRNVLLLLLLSIPIVLLLASYGGRLLANKALSPVDQLTRAAQSIGAKNLKERVDVPKSRDELARLAVTFNQMITRLDEAFEHERRFAQDASHELRTPLAVLRNEVEVTLQRDRSTQEYRVVLEDCLEELVRLSKLAEDLLMLARAETGQAMLDRHPVDLDRLCRTMVDYMGPLAEERGLKLEMVKTEPVAIWGDARRLKQLLLNLLDNAIKYTPPDGRIEVVVERRGELAAVEVYNSGDGIPPEDLPHVFDRFYRRQKRGVASEGGVGLGLAICKWIAEAHGGSIDAVSQSGQGARFIFQGPVYTEADS